METGSQERGREARLRENQKIVGIGNMEASN